MIKYTLKQARRIIVFVMGITILLFGICLIFLPGPALVVIPLGLFILSTEFIWARLLLKKIKRRLTLDFRGNDENSLKKEEDRKQNEHDDLV